MCGLALCGVLGCERMTRAKQCVELIEAVNPAMQAIEAQSTGELTPAKLKLGARHYSSLAEKLGPLEFDDRQMALDVADFRRTLSQAAELCEELAQAKADSELAQAELVRRELTALKAPMSSSSYKMNAWCHAP